MKKRILSGTMALSMIIVLLAGMSISSFAKYDPNEINIGSQPITDGEYTSKTPGFKDIIDDGGTIKREGNTLTLINAKIKDKILFYCFNNDINLELQGENSITTSGHGIEIGEPMQNIKFTCKSASGYKGSLTLNCGQICIGSLESEGGNPNKADLVFNNCTVNANSPKENTVDKRGISSNGNITISNSTVTASGYYGLYAKSIAITDNSIIDISSNGIGIDATNGKIDIINSKVTSTSGNYGICDVNGGIAIDKSIVNASGAYFGIFSSHSNIDVKNNSNVTAAATSDTTTGGIQINGGSLNITDSVVSTASTCYYGLAVNGGDITIQGGKVSAKARVAAIGAMGLTSESKGKIILATGTTVKTGGGIITIDNIIIGEDTNTAQIVGNNTTKYDKDLGVVNAATDVLICGTGTVSVQQPQKPSNISSVTLPNETDLRNAVLTDADKAAIANGADVNIQMVLKSVQAPADSDKVKQSLGKNTLGLYLDISILKTVGGVQSEVKQLNNKIRITFTIPENLRGKDKYYVIRVHDGKTTVLEDLDNDPNTVTFETDQFSTYALVYSAKSARTSDNSNVIALAVMAASSLAAVAFIEKKKVK